MQMSPTVYKHRWAKQTKALSKPFHSLRRPRYHCVTSSISRDFEESVILGVSGVHLLEKWRMLPNIFLKCYQIYHLNVVRLILMGICKCWVVPDIMQSAPNVLAIYTCVHPHQPVDSIDTRYHHQYPTSCLTNQSRGNSTPLITWHTPGQHIHWPLKLSQNMDGVACALIGKSMEFPAQNTLSWGHF